MQVSRYDTALMATEFSLPYSQAFTTLNTILKQINPLRSISSHVCIVSVVLPATDLW